MTDSVCLENRFIFLYLFFFFFLKLRHILTAIHFNYNLHRDVRKHDNGEEHIKVVYPKFKNGEATVREIKVKANFGKIH